MLSVASDLGLHFGSTLFANVKRCIIGIPIKSYINIIEMKQYNFGQDHKVFFRCSKVNE